MRYLQHDLIEDVVRRRQQAMRAADQHAPAFDAKQARRLDEQAYTAAVIAAIRFAEEEHFKELIEVIEQLTSEVAGARDAVEHERSLRRMN